MLKMCWKHKISIVAVWVLVTAGVAGVVYMLPAVYSAEALILVDGQKIPERYVSSTVSNDVQDRLATISQQILSTDRLKKIIDDFDLYRKQRKSYVQEEILQMMRKDVTVKLERGWTNSKPGAFRVAYSGTDPAIVAQVANRIANLYIEENLRTREVQAEGTAEFIQTQLDEAKKKLESLESAVSAYKMKHNGELPEQQGAMFTTLSQLQMEAHANRDALTKAQESRAVLQNALELAQANLRMLLDRPAGAPIPAAFHLGADAGAPAPTVRGPQKASQILQEQLEQLQTRYGDAYPDVKRLRREIAEARAQEAKAPAPRPAAPAGSAAKSPAPLTRPAAGDSPEILQARDRVQVLQSQIVQADKDIETRKTATDHLASQIADYQGRVANIPLREQELEDITRDYDNTKALYRSLLDKKNSADIAFDMEQRQKSERFTIIDPARVPEKPVKPDRMALDALGSLIGLGLGLVLSLAQEIRKDILLGDWELPKDVLVLGRIPRFSVALTIGNHHARSRKFGLWSWRKRLAVISSALASALGILAVGFYLMHHHF